MQSTASSTSQAHRRFLETARFGSLDGLRCASVMGVVWLHASSVQDGLLGRGGLGVNMFFVISGFLITTLLLREHRRRGAIDLRGFYIRRTLRIFPLYFAVLAAYVVLVLLTRQGTPEGESFLGNLPAFATYTSNWFVELDAGNAVPFYFSWSLATEEQYYLVWPLLLLALLRFGRRGVALALAVLAVMVGLDQLFTHSIRGAGFLGTVLASVATPICLGSGLAIALHSGRGFRVLGPVFAHPAAAPAALVLTLAALQWMPVLVVELCMTLLVASVCVREEHALAPPLRWRPVAFVGMVSYGIYLMHMLAVNAVRPVLDTERGIDVFMVASLVVIAMAAVSHRYFEMPIRGLRRGFGERPAPAPAAMRLATEPAPPV